MLDIKFTQLPVIPGDGPLLSTDIIALARPGAPAVSYKSTVQKILDLIPADNTIYNADDSLTGNRSVNANTFNLQFISAYGSNMTMNDGSMDFTSNGTYSLTANGDLSLFTTTGNMDIRNSSTVSGSSLSIVNAAPNSILSFAGNQITVGSTSANGLTPNRINLTCTNSLGVGDMNVVVQDDIFINSISGQIRLNPTTSSVRISSTFVAPTASAIVEVHSTTKGRLPPRMTTIQRNAIASPAEALEVYDLDLNEPFYYNGTAWTGYGGTSVNIFNSDGSLTGDRSIAGGGFFVDFNAVSNFNVTSDTHTLNTGAYTLASLGASTLTSGDATTIAMNASDAASKTFNVVASNAGTGNVVLDLLATATSGISTLRLRGDVLEIGSGSDVIRATSAGGGFESPSWTTGTRPGAPIPGTQGFNTTTTQFEGWNGSSWVILG